MKGTLTRELITLIGTDATYRLIQRFKGRRLHIPREPVAPDHPIAIAIGTSNATILVRAYGGVRLSVPMRFGLGDRNRAICQARAEGATISALVERYNLHRNTIKQILRQGPALAPDDSHDLRSQLNLLSEV
jgi:hypothetical protein